MTVSTAPTPLSYDGNSSTTDFPITWKYNAKSHVVATLRSSTGTETVWALTTNYTLTDPGDTGTLTAVTAPATGETLVITLEPPNTQSSDFPLGGDFPSTTVEDGLDLAAQRDAKVEALFDRALRVPKTDSITGSDLELPIDTDRASKFLAFDADGNPIAADGTSVADDALIYGQRSDTGAVEFTLHEYHENRWLNVKTDFGAVGDNSTDDSAAFQLAFTNGSDIEIPEGTYYLGNTNITVTNKAFRLKGHGAGVSVLRWNGASGGISISQSDDAYFTHLSDFSMHQSGVNVGTAIAYDGSGQKVTGTIQNRTSNRFLYENIHMRGTVGVSTDGWNKHIVANNGMNGIADGCIVEGNYLTTPDAVQSASGFHFYGDGSPVAVLTKNCYAYYVQDAVLADSLEGVFVDKCNFVAVTRGVKFTATGAEPQLLVTNNHISAFSNCITVDNVVQGQIQNNLLYARSDAVAGVTLIYFGANCDFTHITNNTFKDQSSQTVVGIDIAGTSCQYNKIQNNFFEDLDTAVNVSANASYTDISGNFYIGCTNSVVDAGTDTIWDDFQNGGSAAKPRFTWFTDPDTGFYRTGANGIGISTAGVLRQSWTSAFSTTIGAQATTDAVSLELGSGRSGNGTSFLDFVSDATYTDYALRIQRGGGGANSDSSVLHRGTGALALSASDAGSVTIATNGTTRISVSSAGAISLNGTILQVSADKGDAAATLTVGTSEQTSQWNTPITADRAVTLSTAGAVRGNKFRIVRTAAATGAFNLNVGTGPLKALGIGQWCDVEYTGAAWMLTAFGSL